MRHRRTQGADEGATGVVIGEQGAYRGEFHGAFEVGLLALQDRLLVMLRLAVMLTTGTAAMQLWFGVEGGIESRHFSAPLERFGIGEKQMQISCQPIQQVHCFQQMPMH